MKLEDVLAAFQAGTISEAELREAIRRFQEAQSRTPLSEGQQGLWLLQRLSPQWSGYHLPLCVRITGDVNAAWFQQACDAVVQQHPALHSAIAEHDGVPYQAPIAGAAMPLVVEDATRWSADDVHRYLQRGLQQPFALDRGPLVRGYLLTRGAGEHIALFVMHHIVFDGSSMPLLLTTLVNAYDALARGERVQAQPQAASYRDFVEWEQAMLASAKGDEHRAYWQRQLAGPLPVLELPSTKPRHDGATVEGKTHVRAMPDALAARTRAWCRSHGVSPAVLFLGVYQLLLQRYTGEHDLIIGMPAVVRPQARFDELVGYLVNTIAVRARLRPQHSFLELVRELQLTLADALDHAEYPFPRLVRELNVPRQQAHAPVFQVAYAYQNASAVTPASLRKQLHGALDIAPMEGVYQEAEYELKLDVEERDPTFHLAFKYDAARHDAPAIARMCDHYLRLLGAALEHGEAPWASYPLLTDDEAAQLGQWNHTAAAFPDAVAHALFEAHAARDPDAVAVVYEDQQLSYGELDRRANQLARYLRAQGVGPDQLVAICTARGFDMIVAVLGVLKAGGAYVPLDPSYPAARLAYMLEDSAASLVLTQAAIGETLPAVAARVIELDAQWATIARGADAALPDIGLTPRHLAYVIYTSGSTGKPKGVMLEHRGLANLATLQARAFEIQPTSRVLQFASFSFDACVWECAMALCNGAALVLAPSERLLPGAPLHDVLRAQRITHATLPPAAANLLASDGLDALTTLVVAGEACPAALPARWATRTRRLVNAYGPTETTVCATMQVCDPARREAPPIGRPIANMQVHILDAAGQPVPVGIAGEIYLGGAGVARGYLHRPELTAERFVRDPDDAAGRLYRTGDLGRWRGDGAIDFLGRNDHQVKLRGFRIELGEIEAQLRNHPLIREVAVIAREDAPGDQRLVAYLVGDDDSVELIDELRGQLASALPDYMVPAAFVFLPALPITESGKLDRKALPAPELGAFAARQYEAPAPGIETTLAEIWQDVLRVARVGRHDNFFDLGGHSLLIVQMMERLRGHGIQAHVGSIFQHPTLRGLAEVLAPGTVVDFVAPPNLIPAGCAHIAPEMLPLVQLERAHIERIAATVPGGEANIEDIYPLAPLQEGILFHHLLNEQWDTYVAPMLLAIQSRPQLDALLAALQAVVDRHAILRTAVLWDELPAPVQVVYRRATLAIEEVVLEAGDARKQLEARMAPERLRMALTRAPLLSVEIARDPASAQWFLILFQHHIIGDHVSMEILLTEVLAHLQGRAGELGTPIAYRGFVAQVAQQAKQHDAEAFFRRKLGTVDEPTAPFGLVDVHGNGTETAEVREPIDGDVARRVRAVARRLGVSPATLFHAAWGIVIAATSGRDDVVFGSVMSGRLQGTAGADRVLGLFINTLPLRLQLANRSVAELVEHAQREIVELLGFEHASLALAQRSSGITGGAPLFSAVLNYRHSVMTSDPANDRRDRASGISGVAMHERTNYPFALSVDDLGDGFAFSAQIDRRVDARRVAGYVHTALASLVQALETAPSTPALEVEIIPARERAELARFNATEMPFPADARVHDRFAEQVARTPDAIAVIHGATELSYAALDARANQLARYLVARGLGPERRAAICMARGIDMIVAVLGVLKAGAAYVPLDPSYPADRLAYMIESAAPTVILTQRALAASVPSPLILEDHAAAIAALDDAPVPDAPGELAYVIYTSGSTGTPKGVAMPHRAMVNLLHWHRIDFPAPQRTLQFAALGFDVSFQETFATLCTGGALVLVDEDTRRDPQALAQLLHAARVERLFVPFVALHNLAEILRLSDQPLPPLRDVITAGEQLRITPAIAELFARLPGCRLHNHYGPTESHVVTRLTLPADRATWPALPSIGAPIENAHIHVLDARRRPVPLGVAGEIYIGGVAVAAGYLGRPELTAERFVRDPDSAGRLYKTGDLARWRGDGTLDYLGRNDHQVKIRGFRVEPDEIAAQLGRHPGVREAAVIARDDEGEKRLIAYVVCGAPAPALAELRAHLAASLPEFMVPAAFVVLPALPLSPNGKLDRKALPAPDEAAYATRSYEAPEGAIEPALAAIWAEVLQVPRVGRRDNFFALGGHSLLAIQVIVRAKELCSLTPKALFEHPTVAELAAHVEAQQRVQQLGFQRGDRSAAAPRQRGIV